MSSSSQSDQRILFQLFCPSSFHLFLVTFSLTISFLTTDGQAIQPSKSPSSSSLTSNCPGGCVHVITSIFCDHVLEEATCEEPYLRCCVPSDFSSYGTPVETSPPLGHEIDSIYTSSSPNSMSTSASDIVIIKSNHHQSNSTVTPLPGSSSSPSKISSVQSSTTTSTTTTTTTPRPSPPTTTVVPLQSTPKPPTLLTLLDKVSTILSTTTTSTTTGRPPSSSSISTFQTPNPVNNRDGSNDTSQTTTPSSLLTEDCDGTCISPLFTFLCDSVTEDKFCPSGGVCCFNREVTTTPAPIPSCQGTCIPVFFSGAFCLRPNQLIPRTADCMSGTICCSASHTGQEDDKSSEGNQLDKDDHYEDEVHPHPPPLISRPPVSKPSLPPPLVFGNSGHPGSVPPGHPQLPPPIAPGLFSSLTRDILRQRPPIPHHVGMPAFLSHHPMHPPHSLPQLRPAVHPGVMVSSSGNQKPGNHKPPQLSPSPPTSPSAPNPTVIDPPAASKGQQVNPHPIQPPMCPTVCVTPLLKFTCFGSNVLYPSFSCPSPEEICCAPVREVQMWEASLLKSLMGQGSGNGNSSPQPPQPVKTMPSSLQPSVVTSFLSGHHGQPMNGHPPSQQEQSYPQPQHGNFPPATQQQSKPINNGKPVFPHHPPSMPQVVNKQPQRVKPPHPQPHPVHHIQPSSSPPLQKISSVQHAILPSHPPPLVQRPQAPVTSVSNGPNMQTVHPTAESTASVGNSLTSTESTPLETSSLISTLTSILLPSSPPDQNGNPSNPISTSTTSPTTAPSDKDELLPSLLPSLPKRPTLTTCGVKGVVPRRKETPRIIGGRDSFPGEWCWQVALMSAPDKSGNGGEYLCGGALIGSQWVMTAAHCITGMVKGGEPIFIRVGDYDLTTNSSKTQTIKVSTTYIHHNHNGQTLDNDIALLKMESPANLSDPAVCLVCLPSRGSIPVPGKKCTVTGYGYTSESGPIALKVRAANVPIVDDQQCTARINSVTEKLFLLPASSFCAGGGSSSAADGLLGDSCQGDGGGPLVCESGTDGEEEVYEVTGLVSWGFGCGRPGIPAVYVKVSSFIGWINQVISVNNQ